MATPDINEVIKDITADVQTIVKGEIELAKAEMVPQAKRVGVGAGLFGAAGYFAIQGTNLLFICGGLALTALFLNLVPLVWAFTLGFLSMAVILLIIAGILALIGKSKVKVEGPKKTVAEGKRSVDAVKGAVAQGQANVRAIAAGAYPDATPHPEATGGLVVSPVNAGSHVQESDHGSTPVPRP